MLCVRLNIILHSYCFLSAFIECFEVDIDYTGNDLNHRTTDKNYARGSGSRNSASECQTLCNETPECNFFTYNGGHCFLKWSNSGRKQYSGAISGPKQCSGIEFL